MRIHIVHNSTLAAMQYSRDTVVKWFHFLSTDYVAELEELNLNFNLKDKEYDEVKADDLQYSHSTLEHSAFKPSVCRSWPKTCKSC